MAGIGYIASFVYSQLFVKLPITTTQDFAGKTVIVTGSNIGLGFEASKHFARLGAAKVILAVRDLTKGAAAKKAIEAETGCGASVVDVWKLDLSSYDSVKQFATRASKDLARIDALVENAGIASDKFVLAEDNEATLTVNVVSTFLLALLMLPKLKETAKQFGIRPNLVIVSSEVHGFTTMPERKAPEGGIFAELNTAATANMEDRYNVSKLLEVFACREIAELTGSPSVYSTSAKPAATKTVTRDFPVTINFLNPGLCHSELTRDLDVPSIRIMKTLLGRTTEAGSRTQVHAAGAGSETHGEYLSDCTIRCPAPFVISEEGKATQKRVWKELSGKLEAISPGITGNL